MARRQRLCDWKRRNEVRRHSDQLKSVLQTTYRTDPTGELVGNRCEKPYRRIRPTQNADRMEAGIDADQIDWQRVFQPKVL